VGFSGHFFLLLNGLDWFGTNNTGVYFSFFVTVFKLGDAVASDRKRHHQFYEFTRVN